MHPSPNTPSSPKRNYSKNRFSRELGLTPPGLHMVTWERVLGTSFPPFWTGWGLRRAAPRDPGPQPRPGSSVTRARAASPLEAGVRYQKHLRRRPVADFRQPTTLRELRRARPVAPVGVGRAVRDSFSTTGTSFIEVGTEPPVDRKNLILSTQGGG